MNSLMPLLMVLVIDGFCSWALGAGRVHRGPGGDEVLDGALEGDEVQARAAVRIVVDLAACSGVTCGAYMRATRSRCDSCPYKVSSHSRM
jgi:hypothetical protein